MTKPSGTTATEDALPALLRHDFGLFLRFAFAEIGGGRPYQHNWHIDAVIHQLERIRTGKSRRLIVNVPPRHLKSVAITIAWVAWMLGNDPSRRFMCISYRSRYGPLICPCPVSLRRSREKKLSAPLVQTPSAEYAFWWLIRFNLNRVCNRSHPAASSA